MKAALRVLFGRRFLDLQDKSRSVGARIAEERERETAASLALETEEAQAEARRTVLYDGEGRLEAARGLIAKGQAINLQPLEREVQRLCDEIIKLPGVENAPLRPLMTGLIDELTKLAGEVRGRHAQLQEQLLELTARERATAAYVRPGNGRNPPRR